MSVPTHIRILDPVLSTTLPTIGNIVCIYALGSFVQRSRAGIAETEDPPLLSADLYTEFLRG